MPTLVVLQSFNGSASNQEIAEGVIKFLDIPDSIVGIEHNNRRGRRQSELEYQLAWSRTFLRWISAVKNIGRAKWSLTDYGRELLARDVSVAITEIRERVDCCRANLRTGSKVAENSDEMQIRSIWRSDSLPTSIAEGTRGVTNLDTPLSFVDAAEHILKSEAKKSPMHYRSITDRALELGLIKTFSKTPAATMNSAIWGEIRRSEARGDRPRFDQYGRGMFGLAEWMPLGIAERIERINQEVTEQLLERARIVPPTGFEQLVAELLAALGFENVEVTKAASDGGIDVRGTLVVAGSVRIRMAVQAKRWKGNVTAPVVQQVRGSLGAHEQGLIITTSDFSNGAIAEATRRDAAPVALINGERFSRLLAQNEIGVRIDRHELFTIE